MSVTIHGLSGLSREPGAILSEENTGLTTFTESQVGKTADVLTAYSALVRFTSVSPDFAGLALDAKRVLFDEGGQAKLQLVWAGTEVDGDDEPILPPPVWFLKRTPSEEPIDTHPDFETFAGTPSSPLNGAQFDQNGLFTGFIAADPNVWGGTSKYLEFAATVTKTSVVKTSPDTSEVIPRLNTPTGASFTIPSISGRTWMKTDFTVTQRGGVFEVFEEWTMSGQRGWNTTIYPA